MASHPQVALADRSDYIPMTLVLLLMALSSRYHQRNFNAVYQLPLVSSQPSPCTISLQACLEDMLLFPRTAGNCLVC